jgi:hypothetical protein
LAACRSSSLLGLRASVRRNSAASTGDVAVAVAVAAERS